MIKLKLSAFDRILMLIAAVIMLQTLYFKFGGHPDSIHIFQEIGIEPWGRYLVGMGELFASLALVWVRTRFWGTISALGMMFGAIMMHFLWLGVEVNNDGGILFMMAVAVALITLRLSWVLRTEWKNIIS